MINWYLIDIYLIFNCYSIDIWVDTKDYFGGTSTPSLRGGASSMKLGGNSSVRGEHSAVKIEWIMND